MAFFQADTLWINQLADGVAALVLDVPGTKVNVLNARVLSDLENALERIASEPGIQLLIVRSGKPGSFCAGADLHEFAEERAAREFAALSEQGQRVFDRLEKLAMP